VSQRHWEDAWEREALPGFALELTMTRMVQQVSGTQDFYPVHHDREFARFGGHPDIFVNTAFTRAALCRLLTDWVGPAGFVKRLAFQMRRYHLFSATRRGSAARSSGCTGRTGGGAWTSRSGASLTDL
jgi:hypothetical protein